MESRLEACGPEGRRARPLAPLLWLGYLPRRPRNAGSAKRCPPTNATRHYEKLSESWGFPMCLSSRIQPGSVTRYHYVSSLYPPLSCVNALKQLAQETEGHTPDSLVSSKASESAVQGAIASCPPSQTPRRLGATIKACSPASPNDFPRESTPEAIPVSLSLAPRSA